MKCLVLSQNSSGMYLFCETERELNVLFLRFGGPYLQYHKFHRSHTLAFHC